MVKIVRKFFIYWRYCCRQNIWNNLNWQSAQSKSQIQYPHAGVCGVGIQKQTANQRKPTRHPVFYMLIRTHKHSNKLRAMRRDYEKTKAFAGNWTPTAEIRVNNFSHCANFTRMLFYFCNQNACKYVKLELHTRKFWELCCKWKNNDVLWSWKFWLLLWK